jgi:RHS repeat-associated protein
MRHRFGYQGSEQDGELYDGGAYTTEYRMLDVRLGRWFSTDPVIQPWQSSYCSMDNNPILFNDPLGDYSKLGAHVRNFFNGGSGVSYSEVTGEWGYERGDYGGATYSDGLSKGERQSRIDKFKETHVGIEKSGGGKIKTQGQGGADVEWISQYDKRVPGYGGSACKRACYIMNPIALRGMDNGYFVGKENGNSFTTTNQTLKGYQYLEEQLTMNRPVIVGVGRDLAGYWGKNTNGDFTTDHFVVIDKMVADGYHFLDPGSRKQSSGTSPNNIFKLGSNGLYTGKSYGAPMTITWIGRNK